MHFWVDLSFPSVQYGVLSILRKPYNYVKIRNKQIQILHYDLNSIRFYHLELSILDIKGKPRKQDTSLGNEISESWRMY